MWFYYYGAPDLRELAWRRKLPSPPKYAGESGPPLLKLVNGIWYGMIKKAGPSTRPGFILRVGLSKFRGRFHRAYANG